MLCQLLFLSAAAAVINGFGASHPNANHFSPYKSGPSPQYSPGKPTARHKNHCAYVIEKTVSYTVQDGAAPYVKAEYNKCGWRKKCPMLMYRMFYKPMYKVAYKVMTELEWRCCPGFTGAGCNTGPATYGMKAMPPFKGPMPSRMGSMPSNKGPQPSNKGPVPSYKGPVAPFKGPRPASKGPISSYKGPSTAYRFFMPSQKGPMPPYKGQMHQPNYHGNSWNPPQTPFHTMGGYPGANVAPSYPETSFDPHPGQQEPDLGHSDMMPEHSNPLTDDQDPLHDPVPEEHEPVPDYHDTLPDHQSSIPQLSESVSEAQAPSGDSEQNHDIDTEENRVTAERLNRMEEEVQRISLGLETLRGKVTGLEDHLRASLREDANRMLSALLSAAPAPVPAPSLDSTIGFGDLPGGAPDIEGSDIMRQVPNLGDLAEKVAELRAELLTKSMELAEMRGTVLEHDTALQRLNGGAGNLTGSKQALEIFVESKLTQARAAILGGFERRVDSAEERCKSRVMEVQYQCKKELMEGQEQLEHVLNGSMTNLRKEIGKFHAQVINITPEDGCCIAVSGLTERLVMLEQAMDGLNQSQGHLQVQLGGHKDHVEGILEGRLGYVESKLNMAEKQQGDFANTTTETCLEDKMKALESRLLAAIEELGNATAPALLEGQAVPTLETEVESLRKRVEVDIDRFQKQLGSLELVCKSSCVPQPVLAGYVAPLPTTEEADLEKHKNINEQLNKHTERLDRLNATVKSLLIQVAERQEQETYQGEVTLLKVSVHSVNQTLCGLKDSLGKVVQEVGQTNLTWQDREERLAQQVKGVVQLVGRQASMLGAGERRLTRLKGDLQDLRRRLAAELQGCRSAALGVQKEVSEVGGRVSRVEGQCVGLTRLAEDLELIRGELDKQSDGYLSQINNTLISHSFQLSELREGLKNCTEAPEFTKSAEEEQQKNMAATPLWAEPHTVAPVYPRGDQFTDPTNVRDDQDLSQAP